jgi:hypothetical protein
MKDGFTPQQLAKMRDEYGKINTIDPSGPAYKQLIAMLDKMHVDNLKTLAGAKIKFVSGLAQNRVNRAAMKKEEIESVTEMDKSAPQPGRDGKVSHSTYGSRDKKGSDYFKGKEAPVKPVTAKQMSKDALKILNKLSKKEEVELEEGKSGTGYELYHKDFSSAMAHAYDFAKKKYNIEIDPTEIDRNVAMGPKKPSSGKANAYRLLDKTGKKAIQVQVTNLDNKRYELNMYKEDIDEACWDTHKQEGMKKKGDKMVPNCVPKNEAASPAQQAAIAIAMKKAGKKPKNEEKHPEDVKTPANKLEPEGTKKWLATTLIKKLKNIKEAEGGGTSIRSTGDATDAVKRAQARLKSTQLRLKHEKEREAMAKQQQALRKEEDEKKEYPEFKSGGKPLAKKFEKAFAKMGIKTNIKMKTVGNVSINEKEEKKDGKEASAKQKAVKKGETLSGKQEPIKIDPELNDNK